MDVWHRVKSAILDVEQDQVAYNSTPNVRANQIRKALGHKIHGPAFAKIRQRQPMHSARAVSHVRGNCFASWQIQPYTLGEVGEKKPPRTRSLATLLPSVRRIIENSMPWSYECQELSKMEP